ncbi:hypothetical protein CONPUDRAFT_82141 [Coniophora puteana RWD-64-598 SS2]|uniref:Uncharacterized protein n=1 Tax=Coniophora puteana (strain RWD-64-598) TaxID=741705 RepID=A0A5M3MPH3_CONPW|nr:uncharacterized protein CONPUDRAFT_82141 [Coniophora puteana RWD-64-598 SS2]EIW81068.1 hypothetical protein CONPUDRAFT_82141 [Coniophora puteana RWD-64-598 SS2]
MNVNAVRQRIPYKFAAEPEDEHILDEQEQEQLVERFRRQNNASNQRHLIGLQIVVTLSCLLHVIYAFSDLTSPLENLFPSTIPDSPLPLSRPLAMISVICHVNIIMDMVPNNPSLNELHLPFKLVYILAWGALPPFFSLLVGKSCNTTAWWCFLEIVSGLVFFVRRWIGQADANITGLQKIRYTASGA